MPDEADPVLAEGAADHLDVVGHLHAPVVAEAVALGGGALVGDGPGGRLERLPPPPACRAPRSVARKAGTASPQRDRACSRRSRAGRTRRCRSGRPTSGVIWKPRATRRTPEAPGPARVHHQRADPLVGQVGRVLHQRQLEGRPGGVLVAHRHGDRAALEAPAAVRPRAPGRARAAPRSWSCVGGVGPPPARVRRGRRRGRGRAQPERVLALARAGNQRGGAASDERRR